VISLAGSVDEVAYSAVADSELYVSAGTLDELVGPVGSGPGGAMTLRVMVAPHSSSGVPLGQQPASVQ
jgi:hypothetical protein